MESGESVRRYGFLIKAGWPVAAALLAGLSGYLVFADHYESLGRQIEAERAAADRIQVDLRNSQKTISDLETARKSVSEYVPEIFKMGDTQKLIDRMGEKATQEKAVMVDVQIDVPKFMKIRRADDPVYVVPFEASFAGDFYSLGKLLSSLETAPFVYKVTESGLVPSGDVNKPLTMTVKGAVRFFSRDLVEKYLTDGT
jgi:hypothetical protein